MPGETCRECGAEVRATATRRSACGAKRVTEPVATTDLAALESPTPVATPAVTPSASEIMAPPRTRATPQEVPQSRRVVRSEAGSPSVVFVPMERVVFPTSCCCCGVADGFNKLEIGHEKRSPGEIGVQFRRPVDEPDVAGRVAKAAASAALSRATGHRVRLGQAQVAPVVAFPVCSECLAHVGLARQVGVAPVLACLLSLAGTAPFFARFPSAAAAAAFAGTIAVIAGGAAHAAVNLVFGRLRPSRASRFAPVGVSDRGAGQIRFRLKNAGFRAAFVQACEASPVTPLEGGAA